MAPKGRAGWQVYAFWVTGASIITVLLLLTLAMQDRKPGTHFQITWDAAISISKHSNDS